MKEEIKKADDLMRQGESSSAVSVIKGALKETPNDPYLHYLLGIARMKCGRLFLAKKALERANQLLPRHAENLRSLGWVKVMLGQLEEGRNDLREAISLDLTNPLAYLDLAMSYFHYFDLKEGMEWLERGRALAPKDLFTLHSVEITREIEKDYSGYTASELQEMKKEKLNPRAQQAFRISLLENYSFKKPLTRDEAEEIKEEARLNGVASSIITSKTLDIPGIPPAITDEDEKEITDVKKIKKEELFDNCPVCQAMKAAQEQGRELKEEELKEAVKKAKEKGAMVGGEWVEKPEK